MVDIKSFNEKLAKGLARVLEKTDENIVVAYKQFDIEKAKVGEIVELPEEVAVQSIADLNKQKDSLLESIAEIDAFLALE